MVETASTFKAAGSVGSVDVGVSDGGAGVADGGRVADGGGVDGDGVLPPSVAGSNWSGESGSEGGVDGAGSTWIGDSASDIGGGVLKGWASGVGDVYVEEVTCRVAGGVAGGGLAGADSDSSERTISLSSTESLSG